MPRPDALTDELLPVPSVADIKCWIAASGQTRTAKNPKAYTPEGWPEWIAVNPFYLLDMLEIFGADVQIVKPSRAWTPVYFRDDDGNDGIVLPMRTAGAKKAWDDETQRRQDGGRKERDIA
jgi:hypothetical protein